MMHGFVWWIVAIVICVAVLFFSLFLMDDEFFSFLPVLCAEVIILIALNSSRVKNPTLVIVIAIVLTILSIVIDLFAGTDGVSCFIGSILMVTAFVIYMVNSKPDPSVKSNKSKIKANNSSTIKITDIENTSNQIYKRDDSSVWLFMQE